MEAPRRRSLGAAAVIVDSYGRVLLVRHNYGHLNWELPGGMAEPGESIVETTLREVEEETALAAVPERLPGVYYERETDIHHFVFRCELQGQRLPVPSSPEILECGYWPPDALPRPISDFTIQRIRDALSSEPLEGLIEVPRRTWLY